MSTTRRNSLRKDLPAPIRRLLVLQPAGAAICALGLFVWFPTLFEVGFAILLLSAAASGAAVALDIKGCAADLSKLLRERRPVFGRVLGEAIYSPSYLRFLGGLGAAFGSVFLILVVAAALG